MTEMEIDRPLATDDKIKDDDLFKAAENGDVSFFNNLHEEQLLKARALRNEDGRSLLHVAVSFGKTEVVKILSAAETSISGVNSKDEEGWAPLHSAVSSGNAEIVEILVNKGADVNLKNDGGRTALHYAASKGWLKIAELLLSRGAKINAKDKVGCTPLHRAASTGHSQFCELLIEEGAEVDEFDRAGETPLMTAVICDNREAYEPNIHLHKLLVVDPELKDAHRCASYFDILALLVALLLIRHGADVDSVDKEGYSVLGRASADLRPSLVDVAKAMLEE